MSGASWSSLKNYHIGAPKKKKRKVRIDKKHCQVYGLCADDGRIRYIGQTRSKLTTRLKHHFKAAEKKTCSSRLAYWINSTMAVDIVLIDANATWDVSEILWIDKYRREGAKLLNIVRGGNDTIHAVTRESKPLPANVPRNYSARRIHS